MLGRPGCYCKLRQELDSVQSLCWSMSLAVCQQGYIQQMGNCMGPTHNVLPPEAMKQIKTILSEGEIYILHLMFKDLSERIVDRKINMQNFLLFFHKNGFWGQRLFQQFDYDETDLVSEQEFIRGIAKIFKSTQKQKISLLYKFFSRGGNEQSEGVAFNDFLTMLYNYPKEDLKEILNDKDFIEFELKKHLVPSEPTKKNDVGGSTSYCFESYESTYNVRQYLPAPGEKLHSKTSIQVLEDQRHKEELPSMIGKEMIKNLQGKQKGGETVIRLKDGDNFMDIKTINIQQLVKKFAQRIFRAAHIDIRQGRINFPQFFEWISTHKALYENYYDGFHNQVWQTDPRSHKPRYLIFPSEKCSDCKTRHNNSLLNAKLFLIHSILVVCETGRLEQPILTICLEGLAVRRIFEMETGFGIEVSHRDGVYPEKRFFFKNEELMLEWMELFKFYKGESVQKRYEIGEKIGTGKFSVVYRCVNVEEDKEYALKEIATFKLQPEARNLIAHESSIMQIISHPLLLMFKQCIQTKTHIYIITELVKGKDLFEFVKDYLFLDQYDAAKICQQIIVGVRFLHSFEIVHRDLKPQNIMIVLDQETEEVSNIKIIDFGFSNYLSKLTDKKGDDLLAGTPNYIAPEVLKQEEFTFKIDNFAIGVILYFMLTGALPFNDYTITEILQNTMAGNWKFGDNNLISKEAKDLVTQLLKTNPKERISLENSLQHQWFKILGNPRKHPRKALARSNAKKYNFLL